MFARRALLVAAVVAAGPWGARPAAAEPIAPAKYDELVQVVKPPTREYEWLLQIPWQISLQAARERAAAEGKPLFLWTAADGNPLGST